MRTQITFRGADSQRFEEYRAKVAEQRDGAEPSGAELARLMMDQFDPDAAVGAVTDSQK